MVGTLLFTVAFFLFPTSAVYYVFFSLVWLAVQCTKVRCEYLLVWCANPLTQSWFGAQAMLWWALAVVNHFPAYVVALIVSGSGRLPGGISVSVLSTFTAVASDHDAGAVELNRHAYMWLDSAPLSPTVLVAPYVTLLRQLCGHYTVAKLCGALLLGRPLGTSRVHFTSTTAPGPLLANQ